MTPIPALTNASPALRAFAQEAARRLPPPHRQQFLQKAQPIQDSLCQPCEHLRGRTFRILAAENTERLQPDGSTTARLALELATSHLPQEAARGAALTAAGWEPSHQSALQTLSQQLNTALTTCSHR